MSSATFDKALSVAAIAAFAAGIFYLISKSVFHADTAYDYQALWVAGHIWNEGGNPYGPGFRGLATSMFVNPGDVAHWFYPPHSWVLMAPLARFDFPVAQKIWLSLNAACIAGGSFLFWRTLRVSGKDVGWRSLAFFMTFVNLMGATAITLYLGQTSGLIYFGFCLFAYGFVTQRRIPTVIALAILLMKPQIGVPVAVFYLLSPGGLLPTVIAGVTVGILSIPAFVVGGFKATVFGFLTTVSSYSGANAFNSSPATTGLRNLAYHLTGIDSPITLFALATIVLCAACSFVVFRILPRRAQTAEDPRLLGAVALAFIIVSILPLHSYDLMLIAPLLLYSLLQKSMMPYWAVASALVVFRSNNLARRAPHGDELLYFITNATIDSFAILALSMAAAAFAWRHFPRASASRL